MWLIIIVFLQLPAKEGFPVIRVICHESVIYVTGHVSHGSEAKGRPSSRYKTYSPKYPIMGLWLFCVPANRAHPKRDSANINNFRNM